MAHSFIQYKDIKIEVLDSVIDDVTFYLREFLIHNENNPLRDVLRLFEQQFDMPPGAKKLILDDAFVSSKDTDLFLKFLSETYENRDLSKRYDVSLSRLKFIVDSIGRNLQGRMV